MQFQLQQKLLNRPQYITGVEQNIQYPQQPQFRFNYNPNCWQDHKDLKIEYTGSVTKNLSPQKARENNSSDNNILKKDFRNDGQLKKTISIKSKTQKDKNNAGKQLEESIIIEDSQDQIPNESQILVHHYRREQNKKVQKVNHTDLNKQQLMDLKKTNLQQNHWRCAQVPQNFFEDSSQQKNLQYNHWNAAKVPSNFFDDSTQNQNNQNQTTVKVPTTSLRQYHQANKGVRKSDNQNPKNPFDYMNNSDSQQNGMSISTFMYNQRIKNLNQPSQNNHRSNPLHMIQSQPNQNLAPMQQFHNPNYGNLFSPRSQSYWQTPPPLPQNFPHLPVYGGLQLMNQMRYLREEVRMLRQFMNTQRYQKISQQKEKNYNKNDEIRMQKLFSDMKNTIQTERQDHKRQIEQISSKYIREMQKLKYSNDLLQKQNQILKSQFNRFEEKRIRSNTSDKQFSDKNKIRLSNKKLSSFQSSNMEQILKKKSYSNNKNNGRGKVQKTPKSRKTSPRKNL